MCNTVSRMRCKSLKLSLLSAGSRSSLQPTEPSQQSRKPDDRRPIYDKV